MKNAKLFIALLAMFGVSSIVFAEDASSSMFTLANGTYDEGTVSNNNSIYIPEGGHSTTPIEGGTKNIYIGGGSTLSIDANSLSESSPLIVANIFEVDVTGGKIVFDILNLDMGSIFYSLIEFNTFVGDSLLLDAGDYFVLEGLNTDIYSLKFVDDTLYLVQNGITIVPVSEASTYAAVFGVLALAFAAYRRRR